MVGMYAGQLVGDGDENSFFGYLAGTYATGSNNVFLGDNAGYGVSSAPYSSGGGNVGIGHRKHFYSFTTAGGNTVIGNNAGDALPQEDIMLR